MLVLDFGSFRDPAVLSAFEIIPVLPTAETIVGDANLDGVVDFSDFLILAKNFGRTDATHAHGDFDSNEIVNLKDFLALAANFGVTDK